MPTSSRNDCITNNLLMAIELSNSKWKVAFACPATRKIRLRQVDAGALRALKREISDAKRHFRLPAEAEVISCYEAGRDGFWLHRWLVSRNVTNHVVDSSSIEVNRRERQAKTDRIDAEKLVRMLLRWNAGEKSVWSVVRVPTPEQEDARHLHRELEVLKREQTRHSNRIKGLLVSVGIRLPRVDRDFPNCLDRCKLWDGSPIMTRLKERLLREFECMQLVNRQIRQLEKERAQLIREGEDDRTIQKVRRLMQLSGIGPASAWLFVHEVFGWREIKNRRQLASLLGLTPMPYSSGSKHRDQSISKAGNRRMRTMLIEISWCWLRYQPNSQLSRWFMKRFGTGSKRQRRIGIVAMARKLAISLWKYVRDGEIPPDAECSDAPLIRLHYTPSLS